jgi:hypothetical protein
VAIGLAIGFVAVIGACSSSSTPAPVPPAATPPAVETSPGGSAAASVAAASGAAASAAAVGCPTQAIVGAALGLTLSAPVTVPGGGGTPLPAGATGIACDYRGAAANVIIEEIQNIAPSAIGEFSAKFPVAFAAVAGVGDQARSFRQDLNGGKDNEGVVATKGSTLVDITATATPATLAQIEALVSQLL